MFAKTVTATIRDRKYHLAYTVKAMFELMDLLGDKELMRVMIDNSPEGYRDICQAAEIMSRAAEELRRYEGQDAGEILSADELMISARPVDLLELKTAMTQAVAYGYGREIENKTEEIDLGLAELQKKTE